MSTAQWGSGCSTAVEHTPAEQNSWGTRFESRGCGFFPFIYILSVVCPWFRSVTEVQLLSNEKYAYYSRGIYPLYWWSIYSSDTAGQNCTVLDNILKNLILMVKQLYGILKHSTYKMCVWKITQGGREIGMLITVVICLETLGTFTVFW